MKGEGGEAPLATWKQPSPATPEDGARGSRRRKARQRWDKEMGGDSGAVTGFSAGRKQELINRSLYGQVKRLLRPRQSNHHLKTEMYKKFRIQYKMPNREIAELETHKGGSLEKPHLRRDLWAEPRGGSTKQHVKLHVT